MKKVKAYLLDNMEELKDVVREINSWNGDLGHLDYEDNDEDFFNTYFEGRPHEAVRAVCYGDYGYMDDYVKFDGYDNLVSISEYDLEEELKENIEEIIQSLDRNHTNLCLSDELTALINEEDEEEE
ncbi:hypothetical protein Goe24_02500 [Bacillus phage vB_BsuM-Goe24]|uniref:Uncharacterized protein n=1 Tax=Bacillus phage vB_BsuM-Goe3 TaxID=1933063 RepID=A0A217EQX6_BPGO3|nr:hypothetical protein HWB07_gp003 [Bacillus phage vB_BsuM-Goe3]YP_009832225.1 hypothetical protein HWB07_gp065 [Bacillus phage vB_BsuM-Goe3]WCS69383.1 hypothetical protein Goe24_00030 [Bacillus phage vB_BsuM-Goe24]APZ82469.1 hypothetical protein Goe3_c00300 [Bacillus phage vB_BsuM-Goe3]APZ82705.1 hypothetical protein Goe3_c24400 [Bacillus phage vB_BsuM-Goe3]WCS69625.1 hypothetical protein Goe24_02500 [Bacillus phage vB_BsuM-Goe24]